MTSSKTVARIAGWSIVVAIGVLGLKLLAWQITGSVALYSDALESIVNVVAAGAAFWAIRVSYRPADGGHPYGHHKAEYFSAVLEGVLIVLAAGVILVEAWRSWLAPAPLEQPWQGLAINAVASGANFLWALLLIRAGRREKSPALIADGRHVMTDVVTSCGVLVGLVASIATGIDRIDPVLAAVVALNILWQGWKVIGSSIQGLMDRAVDLEEHIRIRDVISSNARGALEVHDLKTRIAGRATFIEFHLVVDAAMTVLEAHAICDRIEEALKADLSGARVIIHVEPEEEAKLPPGTPAVPFA